jgi:hypothetical protein
MRNFPTLLVPFVLYNVFAYLIFPPYGADFDWVLRPRLAMASGVTFSLTVGTLIVVLALVLLCFEIVRAARIDTWSVLDHIYATGLFVVFLLEFLFLAPAATGTFFVLTVIALIDLVTGFSVSIRAAHRDMTLDM